MMANELRIGNLIIFDNLISGEQIIEVTPRFFSSLSGGRDFEDQKNNTELNNYHKPIPLTEEWLLKFGFENRKGSNCNRYFKEGVYPRSFAFQFFKNGRVDFWYSDFNLGKINHLKYNPVKYVHQLQNLYFALTGKEILS